MMKTFAKAFALGCAVIALAACSDGRPTPETASPSGEVASQPAGPIAQKADPVQAVFVLPNGVRTADNGVPIVRAGLWESETPDSGGVKMQFCRLSPSSNSDAWLPLSVTAPDGCERTRSIVNETLSVKTRCDVAREVRNETEMTFRGSETEYETTLTMTSIRSGETFGSPATVLRERWIGECPTDMKDGDRKVVTG